MKDYGHLLSDDKEWTERAEQFSEKVRDVSQLLTSSDSAPDIRTGLDRVLATLQPYTGTDPASLLLTETLLASTREQRLRDQLAGLLADARAAIAGWLSQHGRPAQAERR